MKGKTRDGIRLSTIVRMVSELAAVKIREGANHPLILSAYGLRPCPVAQSSHAERMIAPWLEKATGYSKREIYSAFRSGCWYQQ